MKATQFQRVGELTTVKDKMSSGNTPIPVEASLEQVFGALSMYRGAGRKEAEAGKNDPEVSNLRVYLGAVVRLKNLDTDETLQYTLVSQDEADFNQGKISVTSPIGQGLLGKAEKEKAEIQVPAGKLRFLVLQITREGGAK